MTSYQSQPQQKRVAALCIFALFIICLLLVLIAGAKAYKSLVSADNATKVTRFAEGIFENSVRACDEAGSVKRGTAFEGDMLVLSQTTKAGVFETRFYLYQGTLMQEYVSQSSPLNPDLAVPVMQTQEFSFLYKNNLLTITTDEGTAEIAVRSSMLNSKGTARPIEREVAHV